MKTFITNKDFYRDNEEVYDVLSDFIFWKHREVPIHQTEPVAREEINLEECYLDEKGDFYAPIAYDFSPKKMEYNGEDYTNGSTLVPVYNNTPTLTKKQIQEMIIKDESPEINDIARNI